MMIKDEMEKYVGAAMETLTRNLRTDLELAFLAGVRAGLQEHKRIQDKVFEVREQSDALQSNAD